MLHQLVDSKVDGQQAHDGKRKERCGLEQTNIISTSHGHMQSTNRETRQSCDRVSESARALFISMVNETLKKRVGSTGTWKMSGKWTPSPPHPLQK